MSESIRPSTDYFSLTNLKGNHQKFSKLKAQTVRTRGNSAKGLLRRDKWSEKFKFYGMVRWVSHRQSALSLTLLNVSFKWQRVQKFWDLRASFLNNIWISLLTYCTSPTPIIRILIVWQYRYYFKKYVTCKVFKFSPSYLIWTRVSCWAQLFPPAHPWAQNFDILVFPKTFHKLWFIRKGKANRNLCRKTKICMEGGSLGLGNEQQRHSHAGTFWIQFFSPPVFGRPWRAPRVSWLGTF